MRVFGQHDERVIGQLQRCVDAEEGARGVLCADAHLGYSQPIGGAVAYRDHISVAGVGYDIGCGNKAVLTNLHASDIVGAAGRALEAPGRPALKLDQSVEGPKNEASAHAYSSGRPQGVVARIMDEIFEQVSFGVGRRNAEPVDHAVLDSIRGADFEPQRELLDLAAQQLGTVGAGNHYVDLFRDEQDRIWVGVHFGSRGFGHKTATGFLSLAQGGAFEDRAKEGEMDSPPVVLDASTDLGQGYVAAMELAGAYAYAGRDVVVDKVLSILGAEAVEEIHNHHNFAWCETHDGEDWWVVRKGCTPAFPGQRGFVGATMAGTSVVLEGVESDDSESAFYSTVHGAGRALSRSKAAGPWRKRWVNNVRDDRAVHDSEDAALAVLGATKAKRVRTRIGGAVDFEQVKAQLREQGIELRGANAEEGPPAYKHLGDVLEAHAGTIRVLHELHPIGVAMAPGDTFDPYKD